MLYGVKCWLLNEKHDIKLSVCRDENAHEWFAHIKRQSLDNLVRKVEELDLAYVNKKISDGLSSGKGDTTKCIVFQYVGICPTDYPLKILAIWETFSLFSSFCILRASRFVQYEPLVLACRLVRFPVVQFSNF
ncbi:hypothetical protein IEQ34_016544 [Dendrobium chrysotoxum]|uniref:Uncharacterized protein n=1 Tax=Dendrobium chrysotoxum TaxID=161865 RepID=A0AAV7FXZ5_DENCH|nr:hypothetical protein IEQ34_016544 [Dendrobium chrysotoxum]